MDCYNLRLYNLRQEKKMKRREFATFLGLNSFIYSSIEKGYLKPTKKQISKISRALGEDFAPYLEGDYSYPLPLPGKEESNLTKWFYGFCGKLWTRLVILFLLACSGATLGTGFYYGHQFSNHSIDYYPEAYQQFAASLKEKGTPTLSITNEISRPEFFITEDNKFFSIKGTYKENDIGTLNATATYHFDDYRVSYVFRFSDPVAITCYFVDYETGLTINVFYNEESNGAYVFTSYYDSMAAIDISTEEGKETLSAIKDLCFANLSEINPAFDALIKDKTGMDYSFYDGLSADFVNGSKRLNQLSLISFFLLVIGALSIAVNIFLLVFCFIYGRKQVVSPFSETKVNPDSLSREPHAKKDIFFTPFLPETVFEVIGIILVFFGSLRVLYYFFTFIGAITISGNDFQTIPETFFYLFMVGMFLLYFIDFDVFLDDKRVFRNIVLDFLIFSVLYSVETLVMVGLKDSNVLLLDELSGRLSIPNNFGTITCYFLMMTTLFYTPKQLKTERGIFFYRLLTVIPVTMIVANTLIYHYANSYWGWNLSIPVLNLFSSEKTQFSLLCVTYLLGLFFLKTHYEKKYGREKALALMGGNRFLFQKNAIAASTVLLIGLLEIIFLNNKAAHSLGIGKYPYLILLSPLLLFYHPHKGERNQALDWTTLILYVLSFAGGYIIIAIPFIIIIFAAL